MNEVQRKVQELLARQKLTAEEAVRMLDALEVAPAEPPPVGGLLGLPFVEGLHAQGFSDFTAAQVIDLKLGGLDLGAT